MLFVNVSVGIAPDILTNLVWIGDISLGAVLEFRTRKKNNLFFHFWLMYTNVILWRFMFFPIKLHYLCDLFYFIYCWKIVVIYFVQRSRWVMMAICLGNLPLWVTHCRRGPLSAPIKGPEHGRQRWPHWASYQSSLSAQSVPYCL